MSSAAVVISNFRLINSYDSIILQVLAQKKNNFNVLKSGNSCQTHKCPFPTRSVVRHRHYINVCLNPMADSHVITLFNDRKSCYHCFNDRKSCYHSVS